MYRTHTNGELTIGNEGDKVTLCGWVQRKRDLGGMTFVDLRDRYGVTQLVLGENVDKNLGREFVIQIEGKVVERESKNPNIPTGEIEVVVDKLIVLNASQTPPFTIEDETDGGEELRMKYRYLDLRRTPVQNNIKLRHKLAIEVRKYLDENAFLEIETPYLIKSTPEGARDFVVPSRMNAGQFYALPQSPQTFKQLLMVSGFDRYFQIVRCFRDEDLRADRQPEFTQIDCEMAFVERDDVLATFEGLTKALFKTIKGITLPDFPLMPYDTAMELYGSDKPDVRFDMAFKDITTLGQGKGFGVFDSSECVLAITVPGCASYSRKQLDALTDWVKRPQIGAKGLIYVKCNEDGSYKSSVDKFFDQESLKAWAEVCAADDGDLILVLSGTVKETRKQLGELRLHMGDALGLRDPNKYEPLWVVDFPLLEYDDESERYHAMHHPFTAPNVGEESKLESDPGAVKANAYDLVINGVEIGGGSIRIHQRDMQEKMLDLLGFSPEEAKAQFGFLMDAFEFGAPPHGGIAFGFDRLCAIFGGQESIRDFIAFPKNNMGRDVMIDAPSAIDSSQLNELFIQLDMEEQG